MHAEHGSTQTEKTFDKMKHHVSKLQAKQRSLEKSLEFMRSPASKRQAEVKPAEEDDIPEEQLLKAAKTLFQDSVHDKSQPIPISESAVPEMVMPPHQKQG